MGYRIGLLGLKLNSTNKGCMALACSFFNILVDINANTQIDEIEVFSDTAYSFDKDFYSRIPVKVYRYELKNPFTIIKMYSKMKTCNIIFDFTEGDSFSDIYGIRRMIKTSIIKEVAICSKVNYVLCPQTFGPYSLKISRALARHIINHSFYVCSRDIDSVYLLNRITRKRIDAFTDVAFGLPYISQIVTDNSFKVGFNVSGLLWNGGYNGKNQFGLKVDYKEYCRRIIEKCLERSYSIFLVPHVYGDEIESDYQACRELFREYPQVQISPYFESPMEIKGYIKNMDVFIGARMHATIEAFSAGVITIPIAYSKKFAGLYNRIGYTAIVDATELDTESAVDITIGYLNNPTLIKVEQQEALDRAMDYLKAFKLKILTLLNEDMAE